MYYENYYFELTLYVIVNIFNEGIALNNFHSFPCKQKTYSQGIFVFVCTELTMFYFCHCTECLLLTSECKCTDSNSYNFQACNKYLTWRLELKYKYI